MSVETRLNHGQLYSWRDIDRYPLDWRHDGNLSAAWDLRGLPMAAVLGALERLVGRHETLRTTYHLRDGCPVQRVHPVVALPVEHVDHDAAHHLGDERELADRARAELSARPFDMTDDLGWRGRLFTAGGAPLFLALSIDHLHADAWSTHRLQDDFHLLTADPAAAAPIGPAPREIAHQQHGAPWRERQADAEQYWRRVLDDDIGRCFPTLPARVSGSRLEATLRSRRLGGLAAVAARRHGVSAPSVLLALISAGLAHYLDTDRVTVSLMASNRFTPEHQRVVGTMNQLIPIVAEVDRGTSLAELVKRLHWAGARAYRYSCYDIDRIAALAQEVGGGANGPTHGCWFNHLFRCWFNYLQLDKTTSDPDDRAPAELVWTPLPQPYGQAFRVRVTVEDGLTSAILLADPEILPAEAVTGILRGLALGARLAATDPHVAVETLWDDAPGALEPELFPLDVALPS